jgi:Beta-galactosidase
VSFGSRMMISFLLLLAASVSQAEDLPHIQVQNGGQLIFHGRPFLILGGELGNSEADSIIPSAARMHVNTLLVPVAWEQSEPKEGEFEFSNLDHWIDVARENKLHLVPLWFGSWKNGFSDYAPAWVKSDIHRFPRAQSAGGRPLEILSSLSPENRRSDSRAYARLIRHIREKDSNQTNQGPQLMLDPYEHRLFRVRLDSIPARGPAGRPLHEKSAAF